MKKKTKAKNGTEQAVLVTTSYRGVFFGYAKPSEIGKETMSLKRARLCVYWSADMHGFMGLASMGPSSGCRIGDPADIVLRHVTAVVSVTPVAAERWESAKWPE